MPRGREAWTASAEGHHDTVLLDLGLTHMNGFEVCRALRSRPEGVQATIVAISGWGQENDRRNAALAPSEHAMQKARLNA
jgi:DNA-binding response OmpR family regulator